MDTTGSQDTWALATRLDLKQITVDLDASSLPPPNLEKSLALSSHVPSYEHQK